MSIRDSFLPILDTYRGWLDTGWGLRQYDVVIRVITWKIGAVNAAYPGAPGATKTAVDTPLTVNGARVKVEQLNQKDIIASGGLYQDQDLKIGPITPAFTENALQKGFDPATLDPTTSGANEVLFKITGPNFPTGAWFKKIGQEIVKANFHYFVILRKNAVQSP